MLEAWPFNYYDCTCLSGYTQVGPICERATTLAGQGWAVALLVAMILLVVGGLVAFFLKQGQLTRHDIDTARVLESSRRQALVDSMAPLLRSTATLDEENEV